MKAMKERNETIRRRCLEGGERAVDLAKEFGISTGRVRSILSPGKDYARKAVIELPRPKSCSRCATVGPVEAHHPDYSRPFSVVWLCRKCHGREPKDYSRAAEPTVFVLPDKLCAICAKPIPSERRQHRRSKTCSPECLKLHRSLWAARWERRKSVKPGKGVERALRAIAQALAGVSENVYTNSAIDSLDPRCVEAHNPVAAGDVIGPSLGRVESEAPPRAPLDPSADQPARRSRCS